MKILSFLILMRVAMASVPTAEPTAEFYAPSTPAPKKGVPTAEPTAEFYAPSTPAPKKGVPTAEPTAEFYAPSTPAPKKGAPTIGGLDEATSCPSIQPQQKHEFRDKKVYNWRVVTEMEIGYYVISALVVTILFIYFFKW
jgi:hypothetical protein